jgi:L-aspartate semialdehyde sulfurtransferase ferredoxin
MRPKKDIFRERVYLTFPKELVKQPMLCSLAKKFDIIFNIRGSTVTAEMGLVALEIDGKQAEVERAVAWLREKGVIVEPIEKNVIE